MEQVNLLNEIDEQAIVGFTGKLNILNPADSSLIGQIFFVDGKVINVHFQGVDGARAFYNLCLADHLNEPMQTVIEPELISLEKKKIDIPLTVLKRRFDSVREKYIEAIKQKPPENLKILLKSGFVTEGEEPTEEEYSLMCTLSDYNLVGDIYKHAKLLDYEITNALVSLRKKDALKVVKIKQG